MPATLDRLTARAPRPPAEPPAPARPRARLGGARLGGARLELVLLLALLAVAAALRLWHLHSRPGIDWDEPVYTDVARSFALGHGIAAKVPWGGTAAPYLYHPPFYFLLLGGWMRLLGSYQIGDARTLAALASLVVLGLLYLLLRPRWGMLGALAGTLVLATDGWLVFTNRVSWIENTMLVLLAAGLLVYDRADRRDATRLFVAAGLLLGAAAAYKHIGAYGLGVVLVHWAVTRRRHRGHLLLLGTAGVIAVAYVATMLVVFDHGAHNWFVEDSRVQIERLLGRKASRGSVRSTGQAFSALIGPYKIFAGTLVLSALGALLVAWRTATGLVRRDLPRRVADQLLYAWALVALLFFAALRLKMGHYFAMAEVPLILYLLAELARWVRRSERPRRARATVAALTIVALGVNAWTFDQRFVQRSDDALGQTRAFAQTLPARATFLTEESIGTIVPQPYCKLYEAGACVADARYIAIYRSETQAPPRNATLARLLVYSQPLVRFTGFKERITIYRAAGAGPICRPSRLGLGICRLDPALLRRARVRPGRLTVAHVSFGNYRHLRELRDLRPLQPLTDAGGTPWVVFLGVDAHGTAAFANLGAATVSGDARCRPAPADCQLILLRSRRAAHLELPRIDGRRAPLELKLRALGRTRRRLAADPRGAALLHAATTPRILHLDVSAKDR